VYDEQEVSAVKELVGEGAVASDVPFPNTLVVAEEIARLRYSLTRRSGSLPMAGRKGLFGLEKTLMETRRGAKESEVVASCAVRFGKTGSTQSH